jgi:hypothetical protein
MTNERFKQVDRDHGTLTLEEMRDGWHFCPEFDQLLTQGEERDAEGRCVFCEFDGRKLVER